MFFATRMVSTPSHKLITKLVSVLPVGFPINRSIRTATSITFKLIHLILIAAGSYILVGYELLNNDFRHVKSLFHFVLPPIKSLRVSPERKALAAWSRSNITIFMLPYKKITIQAIHFKNDYSTERLLVNRFP